MQNGFNKDALRGMNVCVTGAIAAVGTRANVANLIRAAGGNPVDSVASTTHLLVLGYKPGATKVTAAGRLGIKTIDKDEFMEMLTIGANSYEVEVRPEPTSKEPTLEHYGDW